MPSATPPAESRCPWCGSDPLYVAYHDQEWGVPCRDDRHLFEMLILEGAQAGLSWITILRKRPAYRLAFAGFDPARVAAFGEADQARLLADPGIVRNRLKIAAAVRNARVFLAIQEECGSFSAYLWNRVGGRPVRQAFREMREIPPRTALSDELSRDLRRRGANFVGSTICYSFLQAVGVVNDHLVTCPRWRELAEGGPDLPGAR